MKALIDTCVIVDVLQKRESFYKAAMDIVLAVSNHRCLGIVTRNLKDYALADLPIFSPEEFLEKISEEHADEIE